MYADDLVLVAPSVKGLQTMLDITYDYGNAHCIKFNKLNQFLCILNLNVNHGKNLNQKYG